MCTGPHLVSRDVAGCECEWCGLPVALTRLYAYTPTPCQPGIKTHRTRAYTDPTGAPTSLWQIPRHAGLGQKFGGGMDKRYTATNAGQNGDEPKGTDYHPRYASGPLPKKSTGGKRPMKHCHWNPTATSLLAVIENRFMFLGSWAFWASVTIRHFQPFSENKIRCFQAFSGTFRHFQGHDFA